jgi:predicted transcriptional regulator
MLYLETFLKKRTRYDIIADILKVLNTYGELRISKLTIEANLPLDRARALLNWLVEADLVHYDILHKSYQVTPKAVRWLAIYNQLNLILQPLESKLKHYHYDLDDMLYED